MVTHTFVTERRYITITPYLLARHLPSQQGVIYGVYHQLRNIKAVGNFLPCNRAKCILDLRYSGFVWRGIPPQTCLFKCLRRIVITCVDQTHIVIDFSQTETYVLIPIRSMPKATAGFANYVGQAESLKNPITAIPYTRKAKPRHKHLPFR